MEEILQDLIKATLERGPQNKQFYSNLSITKGIHDHVEIQSSLCDALTFLLSCFQPGDGFQSKLYATRNCAIELPPTTKLHVPEHTKEILTSVLVLDLLCNSEDLNEGLVSPELHEIISLPEEVQDGLQDFIVPSSGITTFNMFKHTDSEEDDNNELTSISSVRDEFDSGNDSPTSMRSYPSDPESGIVILSSKQFPDDINTTALTLSVLLHQGILQPKPAESVVRWIISNIFTSIPEPEHGKEAESTLSFPTLILGEDETVHKYRFQTDPVAMANFLKLMYTLDISHEELIASAEKFLVLTLKNTIESESQSSSPIPYEFSSVNEPQSLGNENELGNPSLLPIMISSDEQKEGETIEAVRLLQLQHHSPDSLLYFLSRTLIIQSKKCYGGGNVNARPYISEIKQLLVDLLDVRLGSTVDTCDLAMRILAGVYLGIVMPSHNNRNNYKSLNCEDGAYAISTDKLLRVNNLLRKEFELLVSLQDPRDGAWPKDSILRVAVSYPTVENEKMGDDNENFFDELDENGVDAGYLGGKEISTLFAINAISAFLSARRSCSSTDEDLELEDNKIPSKLNLEHDLY